MTNYIVAFTGTCLSSDLHDEDLEMFGCLQGAD